MAHEPKMPSLWEGMHRMEEKQLFPKGPQKSHQESTARKPRRGRAWKEQYMIPINIVTNPIRKMMW